MKISDPKPATIALTLCTLHISRLGQLRQAKKTFATIGSVVIATLISLQTLGIASNERLTQNAIKVMKRLDKQLQRLTMSYKMIYMRSSEGCRRRMFLRNRNRKFISANTSTAKYELNRTWRLRKQFYLTRHPRSNSRKHFLAKTDFLSILSAGNCARKNSIEVANLF